MSKIKEVNIKWEIFKGTPYGAIRTPPNRIRDYGHEHKNFILQIPRNAVIIAGLGPAWSRYSNLITNGCSICVGEDYE